MRSYNISGSKKSGGVPSRKGTFLTIILLGDDGEGFERHLYKYFRLQQQPQLLGNCPNCWTTSSEDNDLSKLLVTSSFCYKKRTNVPKDRKQKQNVGN